MTVISVIIPTYNEQSTILDILQKVKNVEVADASFEVIVIDDGSTDKTVEILEKEPDLYTKLVKMELNGGKGAAVNTGLKEATGDFILFQDADLEYDPADYPKLLQPILNFNADVVMGSRCVAPEYTRVFYFWHLVGNRIITLLFNIFYNTTFTDIYSCYLLYRRSLLDPQRLKTEGWDQHAEILSSLVKQRPVIYEVPISYHGRTYDEGKKIKAHHIIAVIWTIITKRFS